MYSYSLKKMNVKKMFGRCLTSILIVSIVLNTHFIFTIQLRMYKSDVQVH